MQSLRNTAGFFGPSLLADITLVIQILFYLSLCAGVVSQLQKKYKWHDRFQIPVVVLNIFFIIFVMIPTFAGVAGQLPGGGPPAWVTVVHAFLGTLAQGLGLYCMLAGLKYLPRKIGVLRYWMWAAFSTWTATIIFGITVYILFYGGASASTGQAVGEHNAEHAEAPVAVAPASADTPALVEEHAEEAVAQVEQASPTPAPQLVEEHAEEVAEVVVPTATPAAQPVAEATATPALPQLPVGSITFRDSAVHSDQVILQMSGIAPAPADAAYEAWLQGANVPPLSLGRLTLTGDAVNHTFTDPAGRLLLNLYDSAFITLEATNDSDPNPSGNVVYAGGVPPAVLEHVRYIVAAFPGWRDFPGSPDGEGLALNALGELAIMFLQVDTQQKSVPTNNLTDLRIHSETTLNILDGEKNPQYGDRDGDGEVYSPGDKFGLLAGGDNPGYLQASADHAILAKQAAGATPNVALHAGHVEVAAANAIAWATQLREAELALLPLNDAAGAAGPVAEIVRLFNALRDGVDANGNGAIEPIPGEGGVQTMYEHGQLMGSIEIFPAGAELVSEHSEEVAPQEVAPTATPAPQPEATATPELISEHDGG